MLFQGHHLKLPFHGRLQAARVSRGAFGRSIRMVAGEAASVVEDVLHYPETWAFAVTAILLGVGWVFDQSIEMAEEKLDERMVPVVTQSVLELATLGVISLIIQVSTAASENSWLSTVSEALTGEENVLFEQLEVLHSGLFAVSIAFFFTAAVLVGSLNAQFREWNHERLSDMLRFKLDEYDWKLKSPSTPYPQGGWNRIAPRMNIVNESVIESNLFRIIYDDISKPRRTRIAEFLRFRERKVREGGGGTKRESEREGDKEIVLILHTKYSKFEEDSETEWREVERAKESEE